MLLVALEYLQQKSKKYFDRRFEQEEQRRRQQEFWRRRGIHVPLNAIPKIPNPPELKTKSTDIDLPFLPEAFHTSQFLSQFFVKLKPQRFHNPEAYDKSGNATDHLLFLRHKLLGREAIPLVNHFKILEKCYRNAVREMNRFLYTTFPSEPNQSNLNQTLQATQPGLPVNSQADDLATDFAKNIWFYKESTYRFLFNQMRIGNMYILTEDGRLIPANANKNYTSFVNAAVNKTTSQ